MAVASSCASWEGSTPPTPGPPVPTAVASRWALETRRSRLRARRGRAVRARRGGASISRRDSMPLMLLAVPDSTSDGWLASSATTSTVVNARVPRQARLAPSMHAPSRSPGSVGRSTRCRLQRSHLVGDSYSRVRHRRALPSGCRLARHHVDAPRTPDGSGRRWVRDDPTTDRDDRTGRRHPPPRRPRRPSAARRTRAPSPAGGRSRRRRGAPQTWRGTPGTSPSSVSPSRARRPRSPPTIPSGRRGCGAPRVCSSLHGRCSCDGTARCSIRYDGPGARRSTARSRWGAAGPRTDSGRSGGHPRRRRDRDTTGTRPFDVRMGGLGPPIPGCGSRSRSDARRSAPA